MLVGCVALAACKGGGPQTVSSTPPAGAGTTPHSFVQPAETKTYQAQSAVQSYSYTYTEVVATQKVAKRDVAGNPVIDAEGRPVFEADPKTRTLVDAYQAQQLYKADASTVRSPGVTVSYDPRNAQFTLKIAQNGTNRDITFQDPAHRSDFNGEVTPQAGVPNLETGDPATWRNKGVQYLEADTGSTNTSYDVSTFFYELPGTSTKYVTYAGFVRNFLDTAAEEVIQDGETLQVARRARDKVYERAAFVFGERTSNLAVPKTGTASYSGNMIASTINNPTLDSASPQSSYYQWINGTANVAVDFGANTVRTTLSGTTHAPLLDNSPLRLPSDTNLTNTGGFAYDTVAIPAGATFAASSTATIDLAKTGGFTGTFAEASFTRGGTKTNVDVVGSTIDGGFYGPGAEEVGATFRIVGGMPDERVDIIGSFTGAKPK